jgi:tetratricopeptide (TPR) repeat protein
MPPAAVEEHLARCRACLAAYVDAVRARARVLAETPPAASPELVAAALAVPDGPRRRRTLWIAAAAVVVAVAGGGLALVARDRATPRESLPKVVRAALEEVSARGFVVPGGEAGAASAPLVMRSGRPPVAAAIDEAAAAARARYEDGDRSASAAFAACASLLAAGQLDAARSLAEERLRVEPRDATMRTLLAALAHRDSDLDGCERHLREVLRLRPGDTTARFDLGWVLAERGARDEAKREWEQLLAGQARGPIAERTRRELERLRSTGG